MSLGGLTRWARGNVVGLLALFIALGGTGIAAVDRKRGGAEGASHKGIHAKASKVQLNDRTQGLKRQIDALLGQVANLQGQQGIQGPQGIPGPAGAPGTPGATGSPGAPGSPAASASFGRINTVMGTSFGSPIGVGTAANVESEVVVASPNAPIVARDLFVGVTDPPGQVPGATWRFVLRNETLDTLVQCEIGGPADSCNSGSAQANIPAGRALSIGITATGAPEATDVLFGWRATTP